MKPVVSAMNAWSWYVISLSAACEPQLILCQQHSYIVLRHPDPIRPRQPFSSTFLLRQHLFPDHDHDPLG